MASVAQQPQVVNLLSISHGRSTGKTFLLPSNIAIKFYSLPGYCLAPVGETGARLLGLVKSICKGGTAPFQEVPAGTSCDNVILSCDKHGTFDAGVYNCGTGEGFITYTRKITLKNVVDYLSGLYPKNNMILGVIACRSIGRAHPPCCALNVGKDGNVSKIILPIITGTSPLSPDEIDTLLCGEYTYDEIMDNRAILEAAKKAVKK